MKKYFAYIRVSTVKQGERGSSLQEQRSAIEGYAARERLSIAEWFVEKETAAKLGRTVFNRMLASLERDGAQGLIVHKIDRSARNLKDWANLGALIDKGVDVRFAHDGLDLHSRGGRLVADLQAVVAADYVRNLREEVIKGLQGRLKQGIYPFAAPIGYLNRGKARVKELDPINAPLVREAFELYATGRYGLKDLRVEMRRRGLASPKSKRPLSVSGLSTMLNNPFYIGIIQIRKTGASYQGKHEPLIAKALYDRVQAVLRGKLVLKVYKHDFLFRRAVRCAGCGCNLVGERQKQYHIYYRCHSEQCRVSVREDFLDHAVQIALIALRWDAREEAAAHAIAASQNAHAVDEIAQLRRSLMMQIAKCDERLERLMDALLDQAIERERYERRKHAILMEQRTLQERLEKLSPQETKTNRALAKLERGNAAHSGYKLGNYDEKREVVASITSNFVLAERKPVITLKSPFQQVFDWRNLQKCGPNHLTPRERAQTLLDICIAADEAERKNVEGNSNNLAA